MATEDLKIHLKVDEEALDNVLAAITEVCDAVDELSQKVKNIKVSLKIKNG